ncbi:hypothetical protein OKW49_002469 [Paraburkholderia youngii]|uniref:hypothetical protein n=1 Tax=Paraburkholderia TaxID=1822464 RepID=UPI0034CF6901
MKNHFLVVFLIAILVFVVGTLVTFNESCEVPASNATRVGADELPGNGSLNGAASHCLLYGKYCLSDTLRGR